MLKTPRPTPSAKVVNDYLWHGYLPPQDIPDWLWRGLQQPNARHAYTPEGAAVVLDRLFDELCQNHVGPHLVPISGGWDSRLILGALFERLDPCQIETVSFGCPGQLDFEIGREIARFLGVRHHAIDLTGIQIEWSALQAHVKRVPWTEVPESYYLALLDMYAAQAGTATMWSGFLGEALTGGHRAQSFGGHSAEEAERGFMYSQQRSRISPVSDPKYIPTYPDSRLADNAPFEQSELLDFALRQRGFVAPAVLGKAWTQWSAEQGKKGNAQILAPFCHPAWAGYWLNAPRQLHCGQQLYLAMARYKYPKLFTLPSKYSVGFAPDALRVQRLYRLYLSMARRIDRRVPFLPIRPGLMDNYMDYAHAFRRREDYRAAMERAIIVLEDRYAIPWLNIRQVWQEHCTRKGDYSEALHVLLSLAVNLDADS